MSRSQIGSIARTVMLADANAIIAVADQLGQDFDQCVRMVLATQGKVITCGSGTSGAVARRMAHLLSVCGTPSFYLHPADALHGSLGAVGPGDLILALSKGGRSSEVNECVERAQRRGALAIAITADIAAPLAELADHVVELVVPDGVDPGGVVAMGSTVAVSAWTDALATVLMRVRGYTWSDVLFTHPSGAVGQVTDLPAELEQVNLESEGAL